MSVPILFYHAFTAAPSGMFGGISVTFGDFQKQMEYMHHNGFVGVSLSKMLGAPGIKADPDMRKKFILTFDGADISHYNFILPLLKSLGFSATFFVAINEIGKNQKMDWSMVYDISSCGMDVGSQGLSNVFLTATPSYVVLNELLTSKQILEKYTRKRVDFLAAPGGFYNKRLVEIASDVGFKAMCVSDFGYNDFSRDNVFCFKRFAMMGYKPIVLRSLICGQIPLGIVVFESIRMFLRKILGPEFYSRFRRWALRKRRKA